MLVPRSAWARRAIVQVAERLVGVGPLFARFRVRVGGVAKTGRSLRDARLEVQTRLVTASHNECCTWESCSSNLGKRTTLCRSFRLHSVVFSTW